MREPAVAGQFYPLGIKTLSRTLNEFFLALPTGAENKKNSVLACVVPHAGYAFSGRIAALAYSALAHDRKPETAVILCPNHTGIGSPVSVSLQDWQTPLGIVRTDKKLAEKIIRGDFPADETSHESEHSAEVQLPLLQYLFKEIKIVAVCMLDQTLETSSMLGALLAEILNSDKHVAVASTDFSHYVPHVQALANDHKAIDAIKKLDEHQLYSAVSRYNVTMCGPGPVAVAITYAKRKGATAGRLLKYSTSGETNGDYSAVVGYAAITLEK